MKKEHKITILIIIGLLIWILGPHLLYVIDMSTNNYRSIDNTVESQRANLVNQYRVTVTQAFIGIAVLYGVYQSWQRITIAEDNLKVSQEGQITERFTRAIDQLGNKKMEIRLGGIYSLERISTESDKDYWPIVEILNAYIRENSSVEVSRNKKITQLPMEIQSKEYTASESPDVRKISSDIQAILTVIGRRKYSFRKGEDKRLELQGTYLQNADLIGAHFEGANFEGAHLEGANFEGAHLKGAIFKKARLEGAKFRRAHLEGADLIEARLNKSNLVESFLEGAKLMGAHLEGSNLMKAHLEEANLGMAHFEEAVLGKAHLEGTNLSGTHFEGAYLREAHFEGSKLFNVHLEGARLEGAYFERTQLIDTHLEGAYLRKAHLERTIHINTHLKGTYLDEACLEGAYLRNAINLTVEQLSKVKTLYKTELDEELHRSLDKKDPEKYQTLIKNTEQKPKEKKIEILNVTYVYRQDPVTDEFRDLTADEFQQLIDNGIDPKHTSMEEIYFLCGWWPEIKIHSCVKGKESFVTNEYLNWTSAYETNK